MASEDLNTITELNFSTPQKSVRDMYCLLIEKRKKKKRNEINSSRTVSEEKEIDILQNIVEEAEGFLQQHQSESNQKQKQLTEQGRQAEEIPNLAVEGLSESKKRKGVDDESPTSSKWNKGSETLLLEKQIWAGYSFMRKRNRNWKTKVGFAKGTAWAIFSNTNGNAATDSTNTTTCVFFIWGTGQQ